MRLRACKRGLSECVWACVSVWARSLPDLVVDLVVD